MSMNICLRLRGQHIEFKWQTTTTETYRVYFENSHHKDAGGKPIRGPWKVSSQKRMWGKLCQLMQHKYFYGAPTKKEAPYYFLGRDPWERRSWKEDRKHLWEYLVWIRDTPGMEISYS